ncbi:MAG TPA: N-formylglutamate amidohydrolase [Acetobacteraceae bacterium]|jgi:predicted N-formylglutamate amidohydrolase|nr:N-formylglutamate amidohydrolase [Acetobacteraceae bacterium]
MPPSTRQGTEVLSLLGAGEPPPARRLNPRGKSDFLLTADHAGRRIPRALGDLGLAAAERRRHIAWDIGIAGLTQRLAARLDAVALLQRYSRLVIDCNRSPDVPSAFPEVSEATAVPGNAGLTAVEKERRRQAIFAPYHAAITAELTRRRVAGRRCVYVAMHSFTPIFKGVARGMECAVLYHRRPRLSHALAGLLRAEGDVVVGENEPYRVSDQSDYGVPVHAERNGLDYLEIEIRQDLIATAAGEEAWAERLGRLLPAALERIGEDRE